MKVLVTGATGFTGGHLARHLASRGDAVRALVREPARATDLAGAGVEIVLGDLARRETLSAAVAGVEVIYNIAAVYRQAGLPEATYRTVNAEAVGWLVEAVLTWLEVGDPARDDDLSRWVTEGLRRRRTGWVEAAIPFSP